MSSQSNGSADANSYKNAAGNAISGTKALGKAAKKIGDGVAMIVSGQWVTGILLILVVLFLLLLVPILFMGFSTGLDSAKSFTGSSTSSNGISSTALRQEIVDYALTFEGKPYAYGGEDPNTGADCSGFTKYVYGHFNIELERTSQAQSTMASGKKISVEDAKPGDLLFEGSPGSSTHVAIKASDTQTIEAMGSAYGICKGDIGGRFGFALDFISNVDTSGSVSDGNITEMQSKIAEVARTSGNGSIACTGGYCAGWVEQVYLSAGCNYPSGFGNAIDYWTNWGKESQSKKACGYNIPVGAAVVGSSSGSDLGNKYGHVGIYIGNGQVADNIGESHGRPHISTIEEWDAFNIGSCGGYYGYIGWVWPFNTPLDSGDKSYTSGNSSAGGTAKLAADGGMDIPYYNQGDYSGTYFSGTTANQSGCGPVSCAMIIEYLSGKKVIDDSSYWSYAEKYAANGGAADTIFAGTAEEYNCGTVTHTKDINEVVTALKGNHPVVTYQAPGLFTQNGHYLVLRGVASDGKIIINDPGSRERTAKTWTTKEIDQNAYGYYIYNQSGGTGGSSAYPDLIQLFDTQSESPYNLFETKHLLWDGSVSSSSSSSVGSLSSAFTYFGKYESGCNYDLGFSSGDYYHAIGYYQFDNRYCLRDFLNYCYSDNPTKYAMFKPFLNMDKASLGGNSQLEAAWHQAYAQNKDDFCKKQDDWEYTTYYIPIETKLKARGIDLSKRHDAIKGLCCGLSNLSGEDSAVGYIASSGVNNTMSDAEFAKTLCNYITSTVVYKWTGAPASSYINRYNEELKDVLQLIGKS